MSNGIVLPRHRNLLKTSFPEPDFSGSIADVMRREAEEGAACGWRSCTGCHETNEGVETGDYPYSPMFQAHVGSGCSECGGLGVTWEYWSEADLSIMAQDFKSDAASAVENGNAVATLHFDEECEACVNLHESAIEALDPTPGQSFALYALPIPPPG